MANRSLLHPLSVRVFFDADFFNKPTQRWCNFCLEPCTHESPKPLPRLKSQGTFDCRKLFCDLHCLQAYLIERKEDTTLFREMLFHAYRLPMCLYVRPALPRWTRVEYGGSLTQAEWRHWKATGQCIKAGVLTASADSQDFRDEEDRYKAAKLALAAQNPYYDTVFDPRDPIWTRGSRAGEGRLCYNDGHPIDGPCFTTVVSDRAPPGTETHVDPLQHGSGHQYTQRLLFCSPGCALKELHRTAGAHRSLRIYWTHQLLKKHWSGGEEVTIVPAPCRQLLKAFFGPMEIDDWRSDAPRFRLLRTAPIGHAFPKNARLDEDLYEVVDEVVRWNRHHSRLPDVVDASRPGFDRFQNLTRVLHFPPVAHRLDLEKHHAHDAYAQFRLVGPHSAGAAQQQQQHTLTFQLSTIEIAEEPASNQDVLNHLIDESQPKQPNYDNVTANW